MAIGGRQGTNDPGSEPAGASEPITLTDPDGAVTRVAPWSTWTREQVRAPGGEPALVTRIDAGQLWFAAGRKRSPWCHEVKVGPATVSTPRGRFHVTAEPDGGATIACLAGRTRVVAGLREPVLLGPDQTAAVSSDGATLVVMDRSSGSAAPEVPEPGADPIALPEEWPAGWTAREATTLAADGEVARAALEAEVAAATGSPSGPVAGTSSRSGRRAADRRDTAALASAGPLLGSAAAGSAAPDVSSAAAEPTPPSAPAGGGGQRDGGEGGDDGEGDGPRRRRWTWIPEIVAIAALLGVLVAAVVVFGNGSDSTDVADGPERTAPTTAAPTTTAQPTTTTAKPTTTLAPTTTAQPTSTLPPALVAPGTASGQLAACQRAAGGVQATIQVAHRSGGAGRFTVKVGLVDGSGTVFAQGQARTAVLEPGASAPVDVLVPVAGAVSGACELLEVVAA